MKQVAQVETVVWLAILLAKEILFNDL